MNKLKRLLLLIFLILLSFNRVYSAEDGKLYLQGTRAARQGKFGFAFMYFSMLVRDFPDSKFVNDALFSTGEYYFAMRNYMDAKRAFQQFINGSEQPKAKLFAFVYLMKIAEHSGNRGLVAEYGKEIVTFKQLSFLFRESKEITYVSALSKKYKAVYFIDKVDAYIDEKPFAQILF